MDTLLTDPSYSDANMCGSCLHHKACHTLVCAVYVCAACNKVCLPEKFHKQHRHANVVVNTVYKVRYELPEKKDNPVPVEPAPGKLYGA